VRLDTRDDVREVACAGAAGAAGAAGTIAATGATTARPHPEQNLDPGTSGEPHSLQNFGDDSGTASHSPGVTQARRSRTPYESHREEVRRTAKPTGSVIRPIRLRACAHYGSGVLSLARQLWRLPAPPDARPAGWLDRALVAMVAVSGILEAALRPDMAGRWLSLSGFLVWLPTLLVRRTRPIATVTVFGAVVLLEMFASWVVDGPAPDDHNTAVVALLIPYSLARWAGGVDAVVGLGLFFLVAGSSLVSQDLPTGDRIGGTAVVVTAVAVGAALRTRSMLRTRQLDDVRRLERERLARDLHDTVAHHLTAIAISAQAGLAVADTRPEAARDALRRIDEEATRTLAETRKVVQLLRTEDDAPHRPLEDLRGLASTDGAGPVVVVEATDGLDGLSPTVAAALQRIAQEAVANARRHARDASVVTVCAQRRGDRVVLTVTDDGHGSVGSGDGFGIIGMTERAHLLGGHLEAGSLTPRAGWRVTADLPVEEVR
jgi:signal transduction histidine kinase